MAHSAAAPEYGGARLNGRSHCLPCDDIDDIDDQSLVQNPEQFQPADGSDAHDRLVT